jgi:4-amino-4-deoxy-L-arabinose transferase-like glycosyltransferase
MKGRHIWEYILVTIFLCIMSFFLVSSIKHESPTYDEITFTEAGYQFLVNKDFRYDPFNPPLAREIIALPALIQKYAIYDRNIFWPRIMVVIFTILLALLVYVFARRLFGMLSAMLALLLFVFEPNILSHGHYATADLILTFFIILSIFIFWLWRKSFTNKRIAIFSVIIGLTLSAKLNSIVFLLLPMLALYIIEIKKKENLTKFVFWKNRAKPFILFICVMVLTLWSTYIFKSEPLFGYRFDSNRPAIELAKKNPLIKIALTVPVPLGSYISTIKQVALFNYSNLYVKRSYFLETLSLNGSPGYFFPIVFLIKTQIPLLVLFSLSLLFFYKDNKKGKYLLVPLFFIFLSVLFSKTVLAIRYMLPAYPLIIIYSSQVANLKIVKKKILYIFLGIILIWYTIGTIKTFPYFISYMNESVGGVKNRYKYLIDSNYDWGQGLIALKDYQDKNNIKNLQFAYFGAVDPAKYGIKYEKIKNLSINDPKKEMTLKYDKNHTIAISATCWYFCGYYTNPAFINNMPVDIVGGSILIFRKL